MADPVVLSLPGPLRRLGAPLVRFHAPRWLKPLVFGLTLLPFAWAVGSVLSDLFGGTRLLGSNPIKAAEHFSGEWGARFLLLSLAVTPLRQLLGWNWLASWRRMLGLAGFFMACVHLMIWAALDMTFDLHDIAEDLVERWYIIVGMAAFLLLVPLALTSTRDAIKRLGKRWVPLHRLVFPAMVLVLAHFFLAQKKDVEDPAIFAACAAALFAWRWWRSRAAAPRP